MKYGDFHTVTFKNTLTGNTWEAKSIYKYASWHDWHTDSEGCGLWHGDKQITGTCQFTVAGCKTLKAAKAKIRNWVKAYETD